MALTHSYNGGRKRWKTDNTDRKTERKKDKNTERHKDKRQKDRKIFFYLTIPFLDFQLQ